MIAVWDNLTALVNGKKIKHTKYVSYNFNGRLSKGGNPHHEGGAYKVRCITEWEETQGNLMMCWTFTQFSPG